MKILNYAIIRCVCALAVGILLILFPNEISIYLIILIGALFFIPGMFTIFSYYINRQKQGLPFPLSGIGSALFGLWLMVMPGFFANILMYVLGAVLVLAGIHQISRLVAIKNLTKVSGAYYFFSILILFAGVLVLANPFTARTVPIIILGMSAIIYAITDIIRIIRFRKFIEQAEKTIVDVEAEDVTDAESAFERTKSIENSTDQEQKI
ncbi:MAG: HdeD family acid-resistance protein [Phocaeicola sp.]|uniref:HdeD family acid-resistance protein n=1 Tax=Phocaeicola sp. TaxID=2773926 RepID=UPI003F9F0097